MYEILVGSQKERDSWEELLEDNIKTNLKKIK
jgi:hypothetical protein